MEGISTEAAELAGLWNLGKIIYCDIRVGNFGPVAQLVRAVHS